MPLSRLLWELWSLLVSATCPFVGYSASSAVANFLILPSIVGLWELLLFSPKYSRSSFMLVELHVQNLAIIDDLSLSLDPHFNVLTGETGAGKTILVSALDWVRGAKAETALIRSGTEQASVTATFEMENPSAP